MNLALTFLKYYFLKDALSNIDSSILKNVSINNQMLFKYALFIDSSDYYCLINPFKKDHFQLSKLMKSEKGKIFIKECMESAQKNKEDEQKLFVYFIALSLLLDQQFENYIKGMETKRKKRIYIEKMIDSYYFNKNEKISLSKVNIADYFFEAFSLSKLDYDLIQKPIQRTFGFLCSTNYYKSAYEEACLFFNYFAKSKTGLKKIPFFFYDLCLNHRKGKRKAKTFLYHKKIDTTVLNLSKQPYSIENELEANFSLEEVYQNTLKESKKLCHVINDYFIFNNMKNFLRYYQLEEKKKN